MQRGATHLGQVEKGSKVGGNVMRTPIIAGNWKMNKTIVKAAALVKEMKPRLTAIAGVQKVVCPPFTALSAVKEAIGDAEIGLGAQNMYWEAKGAFTGEVSPVMLSGLCGYVILGHSERRQHFGETDDGVNRKIVAAFAHGLTPIVCVGESLAQREAGQTEEWVADQVQAALMGLPAEQVRQLIVAYEPIWAIGTGVPATADDADAVIAGTIRGALAEMYGHEVTQAVRVQYGGSVKPSNVVDFMARPDIDGALVGGASLKADDFVELVRLTAETKR
jgi:triosephosphate isomerase